MNQIGQYRKYVRAIWPDAQTRFNEEIADGVEPSVAAMIALQEVEGLSWNEDEARELAGL